MMIWIMNKRTDARRVRRRAQSVDIHTLASRQKLCIVGKEYEQRPGFSFPVLFNAAASHVSLLLSRPPAPNLVTHFFLPIPPLINFISPHRHANAAVLSRVAVATTVARQHTTLHHPFQKSDR